MAEEKTKRFFLNRPDMEVKVNRLTLKEFRELTADMPDDTVIIVDDGESACDVKSVHTHWHGAVSFTFGQ
jgi:ethanolamine ammonia-lyase small subunit